MNLKKNFVRFICLTLVMCIFLPLISCKKDGPSAETNNNDDENKIYTTNAKNNELAAYGNYVFFEWGTVYRYNRKTEKLTIACRDVECNGKCPLDSCSMITFTGVHDGKLYFCGVQWGTENFLIAYQDILSGDVTVLKTMGRIEGSGSLTMFLEGEYLYYERMILKDGGDETKPEDYEMYICRISLDGKKDEVFIKCGEKDGMSLVYGGKLIMAYKGDLYSIDIETKEESLFFDCEAYDTLKLASRLICINGKVYFSAYSEYPYIPEITGGEVSLKILYSVDVNTGEVKKVLEEPIVYFCVSDDAIYYVPFKYSVLYMPEDYENNKEDLKTWTQDNTVYACDFDGKNIRAVYANDQISYSSRFCVFDGILYSFTSMYNEEEYSYGSKVSFTVIDLETGELTIVKKSE